MIHDDTIIDDDGQGTPDRRGSSAAEGGASAVGGSEVGVGVGGSRLPPHPKPPAHNTTLGPHGMSVPGATNEAGNLVSACGTSTSFGKMRASAEPSVDIELVQEHRRLALIFESIAQGVEPTLDDHIFASKNARIVAEFLNKAPLNAGSGDVRAVLDFAASTAAYSPYRVLEASPTSPSRNAVLAALASEPQSKGVVHEDPCMDERPSTPTTWAGSRDGNDDGQGATAWGF